jgi:putative SOS response-associated peptidase YedK
MCGRYSNRSDKGGEFSDLKLTFAAASPGLEQVELRFNISPSARGGSEQPLILLGPAGREVKLGRFWFLQHEPRPGERLPTTFNARIESIAEKALYRRAIESQRCLIPATGWREFVAVAERKGGKQPYHFVPTDLTHRAAPESPFFAFAGIYSAFRSSEGIEAHSFAIVTQPASPAALPFHDRMPAIVPAELYDTWLGSGSARDVLAALQAVSDPKLQIFASDPIANSPRYEGALAVAAAPGNPPLGEQQRLW